MRRPGTCGLEDIGWSSWGMLQGLREMGTWALRLGARRIARARVK